MISVAAPSPADGCHNGRIRYRGASHRSQGDALRGWRPAFFAAAFFAVIFMAPAS
ncbi:hypothetical protein [Streptomyces sp. PSKA30]|uniref:hypothetical protein n=1 Tax=Streptomyces sp. PSKA30 TaxID=2874597 RepID=UPI001CD0A010|nr:hypothetical protein [Streptomyces sp. PSKA30]MBZ9642245.1 hypothetical protein [Streptomyces sp. PSKA30]